MFRLIQKTKSKVISQTLCWMNRPALCFTNIWLIRYPKFRIWPIFIWDLYRRRLSRKVRMMTRDIENSGGRWVQQWRVKCKVPAPPLRGRHMNIVFPPSQYHAHQYCNTICYIVVQYVIFEQCSTIMRTLSSRGMNTISSIIPWDTHSNSSTLSSV